MLSEEEAELYTGLVPRSSSIYNSDEELQGRHNSLTVHEGDEVPSSSAKLSARYRLTELKESLHKSMSQCRINSKQTKLAGKRLLLTLNVLMQLPEPDPTPQLMTVLMSGALLLQWMSGLPSDLHPGDAAVARATEPIEDTPGALMNAPIWSALLQQQFSCPLLFSALYRRLRLVWRLHSTAMWESEEKDAREADRRADANTLYELLHNDNEENQWPAQATDSDDGIDRESIQQSYRRRELTQPWKVAFAELEIVTTLLPLHPACVLLRGVPVISAEPPRRRESSVVKTPRFLVGSELYWYRGSLVLVKELRCPISANRKGDNGRSGAVASGVGAEELDERVQMTSMETAAQFIQDVACRQSWCHPNVVRYVGGYTEKFIQTEGNTDADSGLPVMSLGYVMEWLPGSPLQSEVVTGTGDSVPTLAMGAPYSSAQSAPPCFISLQDRLHAMVAGAMAHFTLLEAVEVSLQLADALDYIVADTAEVPYEVVTAWLSAAPSNILIADVSPAGSAATAIEKDVVSVADDEFSRQMSSVSQRASRTSAAASCSSPVAATASPVTATGTSASRYLVKYAPPCYASNGLYSRWRPDPHSTSPGAYAVVQVLLILLTGIPPYRRSHTQEELSEAIAAADRCVETPARALCAEQKEDEAWGVSVKTPAIQRHSTIPGWLPPSLRQLCKSALSTSQSPHPLTLSKLREALQAVRVELNASNSGTQPLAFPTGSESVANSPLQQQSLLSHSDQRSSVTLRGSGSTTFSSSMMRVGQAVLDDYGC